MSTQVATRGGEYTVQETPHAIVQAIHVAKTPWIVLTDDEGKKVGLKHGEIVRIHANESAESSG